MQLPKVYGNKNAPLARGIMSIGFGLLDSGGDYFPAVFCLALSASRPTVRPGKPAASK